MPWRSAAAVFHGGTEQIESLKHWRVRPRTALSQDALNEPTVKIPHTVALPSGSIVLLAAPQPDRQDELLTAYPVESHTLPPTIDRGVRSGTLQIGTDFQAPVRVEQEACKRARRQQHSRATGGPERGCGPLTKPTKTT